MSSTQCSCECYIECCHASCVGVFFPCVMIITTHNLLMFTSHPKVSRTYICTCSSSHSPDPCLFVLQSGLLHGPPTHTHQAHEGSSSNFLPQTYQEPFSRTGSGEVERLKRQAARRTGNAMHACASYGLLVLSLHRRQSFTELDMQPPAVCSITHCSQVVVCMQECSPGMLLLLLPVACTRISIPQDWHRLAGSY